MIKASLFEETNGPRPVGPLLDYMAKVELDDVTTSDLAGKTERDAMQEDVEETEDEDNDNAMVVDNAKSVVVGGRKRKKKTRRKKRKRRKKTRRKI